MVLGFLPKAQRLNSYNIEPTIQKGLHLNIYKAVALGKQRAAITLQPYQHLNVKKKRLPTMYRQALILSYIDVEIFERQRYRIRVQATAYLVVEAASCV